MKYYILYTLHSESVLESYSTDNVTERWVNGRRRNAKPALCYFSPL